MLYGNAGPLRVLGCYLSPGPSPWPLGPPRMGSSWDKAGWCLHFKGLPLEGERSGVSDACLLCHPVTGYRGLVSLGQGCHI